MAGKKTTAWIMTFFTKRGSVFSINGRTGGTGGTCSHIFFKGAVHAQYLAAAVE